MYCFNSSWCVVYLLQAVLLIASYLKVPLRYPVRFGGSHSYIIDYAPSVEPTSSDSSSNTSVLTNLKHVEFPLFLDGQDTTRTAYAVFLLNKVHYSSKILLLVFSSFITHWNFSVGKLIICFFNLYFRLQFSIPYCKRIWDNWNGFDTSLDLYLTFSFK